jgi:hypothetical protein
MQALVHLLVTSLALAPGQANSLPTVPPLVAHAALVPIAKSDAVLRWNEIALDAIRAEQTPPPMAARNLAIVHAALYDAVNAVVGSHARYRISTQCLPGTSPEAAAAAAAHGALSALYPRERVAFDRALAADLASVPEGPGKAGGVALGRFVADRMLEWRSRDGFDGEGRFLPVAAPGMWQRTPPDFAEPLLPHWPALTPFAVTPSERPRPRDPPRLTDAAYTAAFQEVKEIGAANSRTRSAEQTLIARFWADGGGTCTPPGHWNLIAQQVAKQRSCSLAEDARLFALLNITLADAGIMCWDCKYRFAYWRPVTAIHNADKDGNPATDPDPLWMPLLTTPPFPSYTSGHSSFSGAGAAVLIELCGDAVRFQTTSDAMPGVTRSFSSIWAAAEEAGQSRIYGGIHWQFDNQEGLAMGRSLARSICRKYLLAANPGPVPGGSTGP